MNIATGFDQIVQFLPDLPREVWYVGAAEGPGCLLFKCTVGRSAQAGVYAAVFAENGFHLLYIFDREVSAAELTERVQTEQPIVTLPGMCCLIQLAMPTHEPVGDA